MREGSLCAREGRPSGALHVARTPEPRRARALAVRAATARLLVASSAYLGTAGSPGLAPRIAAAPAGEARTGPAATADDRFAAFASELANLVNATRREVGAPELVRDREATAFAEAEARRLVEAGRLDHRGADGSRPYERWERNGGTTSIAENLFRLTAPSGAPAYMSFDPERAHARFLHSSGHRHAMIDPLHTGLGVAVAFDPGRNSMVVVEEFVDRLLAVDPGRPVWPAGEARELWGRVVRARAVEPWMAALVPGPAGNGRAGSDGPPRVSARGEPKAAFVLPRAAFTLDRSTGEFTLRARVPASAAPGPYRLVLYVAPARGGEAGPAAPEPPTPAAVFPYEVVP